jgi:hypothetical protein
MKMIKKRLVSVPVSRAGWLPFLLIFFWVTFAAWAATGEESSPAVVDPVTKGLSGISKIVHANPDDFTFAVFGDNRGSKGIFERILSMISGDPDILFAVSGGDIVSTGTKELFDFFFSQVNQYLTKPLVFAVGNHELLFGGTTLYDSEVGRRNYSFTFGNAYFIVIDDTNEIRMDSGFKEWLKKELDDAEHYRETLVFMHVPLYDPRPRGRHCLEPAAAEQLLKIFEGHRITYIFCSHIHGYFTGDWKAGDGKEIPYTISGGAGVELIQPDDPDHYFFHYLKVHVRDGAVTVEPVPVSCGAK